MSAERTKQIVIAGLFLCFGVIVCILGYTRITSLFNMMEVGSNGQAPVRSLMDKSNKHCTNSRVAIPIQKSVFEGTRI